MRKQVLRRGWAALWAVTLAMMAGTVSSRSATGYTPESPEVQRAVARAIEFLASDGASNQRLGAKALAGLALLGHGGEGLLASPPCFLKAEAGFPIAVASLPFSPLKLVCLVVWVYLCLYLVQRVQTSPLVTRQYKTAAYMVSLFAGPLLFLVLLIVDVKRSSQRNENVYEILKRRVAEAIARMRTLGFKPQEDDSRMKLLDSAGTDLEEIWGHGDIKRQDRHILDLTEEIISNALQQRASDILIDPIDDRSYAIRLRVDGILRRVRELDAETCRPVINSVKVVATMDISERRRPQDGAFMAKRGAKTASFRVASAGVVYGEKLAIRVLNQGAATSTLADLGFSKRQHAIIEGAIRKPSGMLLVCGPTGSGKTTTLYAMLNEIDLYTRNVITVEDPIEALLPEASQIEINPKAGVTFPKALRSILRQDPDVICVGEIRDEETAEIGLRAAQTGHLVLATIHCDSNAAALVRLLDLGVSPLMLSSGLSVLVTQRLLRLLCSHCKRPVELGQEQIHFFRKSGISCTSMFEAGACQHCGETGYFGRMAICDVLPITDQLKSDIVNKKTLISELERKGSKTEMSNLKKQGLRKLASGLTSLDELKRVVG